MYGNVLSGEFYILSAPTNYLLNLNSCFSRCQLEVESFISSSYACGHACLTEDEMNVGATLIEFGGGCTSISIFERGKMIFSDAVPIGGAHVSNDLARGLGIELQSAERIKNLYGLL